MIESVYRHGWWLALQLTLSKLRTKQDQNYGQNKGGIQPCHLVIWEGSKNERSGAALPNTYTIPKYFTNPNGDSFVNNITFDNIKYNKLMYLFQYESCSISESKVQQMAPGGLSGILRDFINVNINEMV